MMSMQLIAGAKDTTCPTCRAWPHRWHQSPWPQSSIHGRPAVTQCRGPIPVAGQSLRLKVSMLLKIFHENVPLARRSNAECGAGLTEIKNNLGRTALHIAAQQGHSAVVQALLQAGAQHSTADDAGQTALHVACCSGDPNTVSLLIRAGAKRDAVDTLDRQPIDHIGCHRVRTECHSSFRTAGHLQAN